MIFVGLIFTVIGIVSTVWSAIVQNSADYRWDVFWDEANPIVEYAMYIGLGLFAIGFIVLISGFIKSKK